MPGSWPSCCVIWGPGCFQGLGLHGDLASQCLSPPPHSHLPRGDPDASGQSLWTLFYRLDLLCEIIAFGPILKCQGMRKALNIYRCWDSLMGYLKEENVKCREEEGAFLCSFK